MHSDVPCLVIINSNFNKVVIVVAWVPLCWYEEVKKTLAPENHFLSYNNDKHCTTYVMHIWKKIGFILEIDPNFTWGRILHRMDARFTNMIAFIGSTKRKLDPLVFFALSQNIRECVRDLSIADIDRAEGLKSVTDKLDEIYLRQPNTHAYIAFKDFYSYKRDIDVKINDFLMRYEFLYQKFQKFGMTLPDGVQAFFKVKYPRKIKNSQGPGVQVSTIQQWKIH